MFGYFNPRNSKSFFKIRDKFKKYYCSTCKALQYNYGYLSKAFLSYDIALLVMLLDIDVNCAKPLNLPCPYCGSFRNVKKNESWKAVAALNLLLFAEKLNDDIHDDKSLIAKILMKLYRVPIDRATNDFSLMAKETHTGYQRILELEESAADAITIATEFSKMMCLTLKSSFSMSEQQEKIISAVSAWIYIIDAVDDYDKDAKSGSYNPFVKKGLPFKKYLYVYWEDITSVLDRIFRNCLTYDDIDFDYQAAEILINQFIPDVTQKVINRVSLTATRLKLTWYFCRLRPNLKER
jgi:hypothetical protein